MKTERLFLIGVVLIALFLYWFQLPELMTFIGDQGWFYLSAKDLVEYGDIPLVGITSSNTWLHQGPFWTYILASIFTVFGFNPVFPGFFTGLFGVATVLFLYIVVREMFSTRVALLSALLYTTSPLVIVHTRMPYHTTPIPFFTIAFVYVLYRWVKGEISYFPLVIASIFILYNFQLSTQILWLVVIMYCLYIALFDKKYLKKTFSKRNILYSLGLSIAIMLPILVYDFSHGFPQTIKYAVWFPYKIVSIAKDLFSPWEFLFSSSEMFDYFRIYFSRIIFPSQLVIFGFLLSLIFIYVIDRIRKFYNEQFINAQFLISFLFAFIVIGIYAMGTPSEAYLPILFFFFPILTVLALEQFTVQDYRRVLVPIIVTVTAAFNMYYYIGNMDKQFQYGPALEDRKNAVQTIITMSKNQPFQIKAQGKGAQFQSFLDSYKYLFWYYGARLDAKSNMIFSIEERNRSIIIKRIK